MTYESFILLKKIEVVRDPDSNILELEFAIEVSKEYG